MKKLILLEQKTLTEYVPKDQKYIIDYLHNPHIPLFPLLVMATKINCDMCKKDFNESETYQAKIKKIDNGNVLVSDLCHGCFMSAIGDKVPRVWKKWSTETKKYVNAE